MPTEVLQIQAAAQQPHHVHLQLLHELADSRFIKGVSPLPAQAGTLRGLQLLLHNWLHMAQPFACSPCMQAEQLQPWTLSWDTAAALFGLKQCIFLCLQGKDLLRPLTLLLHRLLDLGLMHCRLSTSSCCH